MLVSYKNIQQLLPLIIEGKVIGEQNIPISGAQVYFVPRIEETHTAVNGTFKISTWMSLPVTLVVCHKNFECYKQTIADTSETLVIKLKEK